LATLQSASSGIYRLAGPLREKRLKLFCSEAFPDIVEPLVPIFAGLDIERVVLSVPGTLSAVPFEALFDEPSVRKFMGRRLEFMYLPSFRVGAALIARAQEAKNDDLLVIGYGGTDIKSAREETEAIEAVWRRSHENGRSARVVRLEGAQCTKRRVIEELNRGYGYIHFACHGSFDRFDPLNSALHLTKDSGPDKYRVTARDILGIRLANAPIVTLSACSSALTAHDRTNSSTGLAGSFFAAGARVIIGTRWQVYDGTALTFMCRLYSRLVSSDRGRPQRCFNAVQEELREDGFSMEDWAAFGYLGSPI
jgi:CHAT domain-containing protein